MKDFEYVHPTSVSQATQLLVDAPAGAKPIAGGVDLIGEIAPKAEQRQKLLVDNPQRLYRFTS